MKKFRVRVYEIHSFDVEVEANSADEAKEKVNESLMDIDNAAEYSHTLESEDWPTPIEIK